MNTEKALEGPPENRSLFRPSETKRYIEVGPCSCGGYGVVYDEETQEQLGGTCHDSLGELTDMLEDDGGI